MRAHSPLCSSLPSDAAELVGPWVGGVKVTAGFYGVPARVESALLDGLAPWEVVRSSDDGPRAPQHVHLAFIRAGTRYESPMSDGELVFFNGNLRAYREGQGFRLRDGLVDGYVDGEGKTVEIHLPDVSSTELRRIVDVTVVGALVLALRHHGVFHVHAAGVISSKNALMVIAGAGGRGKTTTALSLLRAGLRYLSDDALFVMRRRGEVRVDGVAKSFHIGESALVAMADLRRAVSAAEPLATGKWEFDPRRAFPGQWERRWSAPSVLVFPRIVPDGTTRLVPIAPADALGRLIEASAWVLMDGMPRRREHLDLLTSMANEAKAFELLLGPDARTDAELVPRLFADEGAF